MKGKWLAFAALSAFVGIGLAIVAVKLPANSHRGRTLALDSVALAATVEYLPPPKVLVTIRNTSPWVS